MLQLNYRISKIILNLEVSQLAANLYTVFAFWFWLQVYCNMKIKNDILEVPLDLLLTSKWRAKADGHPMSVSKLGYGILCIIKNKVCTFVL